MSIYTELGITRRGRYKGHKGKFWDVFAYYICLRDYKKYGKCITCNQPKELRELQAGHFIAIGNCGFALAFDESNVHGECEYDNAFNSNHLITYRQNLITRIGLDKVHEIEERYKNSHYRGVITKEWSKREYEAKTAYYIEKIKALL